MKRYKHYSFDLWDTLIRSNKAMVSSRADYLQNKLLALDIPIYGQESIHHAFNSVKSEHDYIVASTGRCLSPEQLYAQVLSILAVSNPKIKDIANIALIEDLVHDNDLNFINNLPKLYNDDVIPVLEELSKTSTISLLCNTGFVGGYILRTALFKLEFSKYMKYMWFSNEDRLWAKPSKEFFENIEVFRYRHACDKSDILHVGDTILTDQIGAVNSGYDFYQVHSNDGKLIDLIS